MKKDALKNLSKDELKNALKEMSYEQIVRDENVLEIALSTKTIPFKVVEAGIKKGDSELVKAIISHKYHPGEETILQSPTDALASELINAFYTQGSVKLPFITKLSNLEFKESVIEAIYKLDDSQLSIEVLKTIDALGCNSPRLSGIIECVANSKNEALFKEILNSEIRLADSLILLLIKNYPQELAKAVNELKHAYLNQQEDQSEYAFHFFGKEYFADLETDHMAQNQVISCLTKRDSNTVFISAKNLIQLFEEFDISGKTVSYNESFEDLDQSVFEKYQNRNDFDYVPLKSKHRPSYILTTATIPPDITERESVERIKGGYKIHHNAIYVYQYAAVNDSIAARVAGHDPKTLASICGELRDLFGETVSSQVAEKLLEYKKTARKLLLPYLPENQRSASTGRKKQWYKELNDAVNAGNFDEPINSNTPGIKAILERYSITQYIQAKVSDKRLSHEVSGEKIINLINKTPISREDALSLVDSGFRFHVGPKVIKDESSPLYANPKDDEFFEYLITLVQRGRLYESELGSYLRDISTSKKNYLLEFIANKEAARIDIDGVLQNIEHYPESDLRSIIKLIKDKKLDVANMEPAQAVELLKYMTSSGSKEIIDRARQHKKASAVGARYENGDLFLTDKEVFEIYYADYDHAVLVTIQQSKRPATGAIDKIAKKTFPSLFEEIIFAMDSDKTDAIKAILAHFNITIVKLKTRTKNSKTLSKEFQRLDSIMEIVNSGGVLSEHDHDVLVQVMPSSELKKLKLRVEETSLGGLAQGPEYEIEKLEVRDLDVIDLSGFNIKKVGLLDFYIYSDNKANAVKELLPLLILADGLKSGNNESAITVAATHPELSAKFVGIEQLMEEDLASTIELTKYFFTEVRSEVVLKKIESSFNTRGLDSDNLDLLSTDFTGIEHLFEGLPYLYTGINKNIIKRANELKMVLVDGHLDRQSGPRCKYLVKQNPTGFSAIGLENAHTNKDKIELMEYVASLDPRYAEIINEFRRNFNLTDMTHLRNYDEMSNIVKSLGQGKLGGYAKQPWFIEKCKPGYLAASKVITKLQEACGDTLDLSILFEKLSDKGATGWSSKVLAIAGEDESIDALVTGIKQTDFKSIRTQELANFILENASENTNVIRDGFQFVKLAKERISDALVDLNEAQQLVAKGADASELLSSYTWVKGIEEYNYQTSNKEQILSCLQAGLKTVEGLGTKYASVMGLRKMDEIHDEANSIAIALDKSRGNYSLNQNKLKKLSATKDVVGENSPYTLMVPQKCAELVEVSTRYGWCTKNAGGDYHKELQKGNACILWICRGEPTADNVLVQFYMKRGKNLSFDISTLQAMYRNNREAVSDFDYRRILKHINKVDSSGASTQLFEAA